MAKTGPIKHSPLTDACELFARQPQWPEDLVAWFQEQARDLPWRRDHDPYLVWLSEVMLQQTQVERVLRYFDRWLDAFPDIQAVAQAPIERILALWQGLGYYSRARNFHRATQIVADQYDGRVPRRFEDLLRLPGVGRYTAGAIMAFAYNEPFATIEANTERVYARLTDEGGNLKQARVYRLMEERLTRWIPENQARLFNQGLMELGSLVCSPKQPRCDLCPLAKACLARRRGRAEQLPVLQPTKSRIKVQSLALVVLRADGRVLLFQRPPQGLWAGFWELPDQPLSPDESTSSPKATKKGHKTSPGTMRKRRTEALSSLLQELGPIIGKSGQDLDPATILHLGRVKHSYTRYSAQVECCLLRLPDPDSPTASRDQRSMDAGQTVPRVHRSHRWAAVDELADLPLHAGHRKCLALVQAKLSAPSHR